MKKLIYLSVLAFFAGSISSCKQENHPQVLNGIVYDATMNNITLITGKGDTINISTMDANPDKVPGVLLEDSVEGRWGNPESYRTGNNQEVIFI